jgi:hypothetical protein
MARSLLIFLFSFSAYAQFLGFGGADAVLNQVPEKLAKLKSLDVKADPAFEDTFNQAVRQVELSMEQEKLFCSGEVADDKGRILPKDKKQLCMRELKKNYLEVISVIFDMKKKYLTMLHAQQIESLTEIHRNQKADIEKKF